MLRPRLTFFQFLRTLNPWRLVEMEEAHPKYRRLLEHAPELWNASFRGLDFDSEALKPLRTRAFAHATYRQTCEVSLSIAPNASRL